VLQLQTVFIQNLNTTSDAWIHGTGSFYENCIINRCLMEQQFIMKMILFCNQLIGC